MNSVLWQLIFFLLRLVFSISKDFIEKAFALVASAEGLKHEDGTPFSGKEKYQWVFDKLVVYAESYDWSSSKTNIINTVIELTVGYMNSFKK